jgi:hypothetical protein
MGIGKNPQGKYFSCIINPRKKIRRFVKSISENMPGTSAQNKIYLGKG